MKTNLMGYQREKEISYQSSTRLFNRNTVRWKMMEHCSQHFEGKVFPLRILYSAEIQTR
jgi:hypothetical protein